MAERLDTELPPRGLKYPWDQWLDGSVWRIEGIQARPRTD